MRDLPELKLNLSEPEGFGNVAKKLNEDARKTVATDIIELVNIDDSSMNEWRGEAQGYIDAVNAGRGDPTPQDREQEGAGEKDPPSTEMTLAAVIQFSARATAAILSEPDLAKASEPGGEKLAAWVSSQLRTKDPNWVLDTDPLVVHMSVTGLAWRKRSFDELDKVFHSYFLSSTRDVIINANVRSAERAPRITHQFERYPYEIERAIERGHWIDYGPKFEDKDPQATKQFFETDMWLDLDGDGIAEPWTVVISRDDTPEVIRIRPRWSKKSVVNTKEMLVFNPIRRFYPYRFLPDPDGGFFPMGFGKLLSRIEGSADMLLSAIVDTAESASNDGGIYTGEGFGLPDKIELKRNRATKIPSDGGKIGDMWAPFPVKQVSPGSVQILEKVITLGDRQSGTLNMLENAPASMTATLAKGIIDTGTQVQSAVHRRMVESLTQEIREFVGMAAAYDQLPDDVSAIDASGVAVTADPALATEMQRSALIGFHMEMVKEFGPFQAINVPAVAAEIYRIARVANGEQFVAQPQPMQATPKEKMDGAIAMMKEQREKIKTTADAAVKLTQSLKNMVDASGGMLDNRAALLQMATLEQTVQQLMSETNDVGNGLDGMASQQPNQSGAGVSPGAAGGDGQVIPGGAPGGPGEAGAGGGLS